MKRNAVGRAVAAVIGVLLVAGACGGSKAPVSESATPAGAELTEQTTPVDGGTITWGLEAETDGLNPISGRWAMSGHMMGSAIFDPLATIDENGQAVPYLAQSITPNDDYTKWVVTLHPDVEFHDGTPLTAEVVADTFRMHQDSAITARVISDLSGIQVTGPLEVTFTTSSPWATFPYVLTTQAGYIPAPAMLQTPEQARTPIGTGPFVFQEWDYGTSFKARKNTDYWQSGKPHLDSIEFRMIPDAQKRRDDLLNGEIDAMNLYRPGDIRDLQDAPGIKVSTYDKGELSFTMLNSGTAPFNSQTARLAVASATDSNRIHDEVFGAGHGTAPQSIWPEGQLGYREDAGYPAFDLSRAKELVAQYETETGKELAFTYTAADDIDTLKVQQLQADMWRAAGMQVELKTVDQADLVVLGALGNYQAVDWRNFGQPDPDSELVWLHSRNIDKSLISLNFAQFADPNLDDALERGQATADREVRDEAYAEVSQILNDNTPYIWLYRVSWAIASIDDVHGYEGSTNGTMQTLGAKTWVADLWRS